MQLNVTQEIDVRLILLSSFVFTQCLILTVNGIIVVRFSLVAPLCHLGHNGTIYVCFDGIIRT